jgi:predicted GNAT superfamily acetyltransferase
MATSATVEVTAEIRALDHMAEFVDAMEVLRSIWGFPQGEPPLSAEIMRALSFAGGYVAGAFADGALIGASAGFLAQRDGHVHLHSHISGVVPQWQGRHVGLALKQHQRGWALERGIDVIEWTFDPLVRRNAFFNLVKLGARVVDFKVNFYGEMNDAINAGDPTDRGVIEWDLKASSASVPNEGDVILEADSDSEPVVRGGRGPVLRAWIPEDVVALRQTDPDAARRWRLALRDSVGEAIADGYVAVSMDRDGWYTLVRSS